jgi:hypothetical protein
MVHGHDPKVAEPHGAALAAGEADDVASRLGLREVKHLNDLASSVNALAFLGGYGRPGPARAGLAQFMRALTWLCCLLSAPTERWPCPRVTRALSFEGIPLQSR